MSPLRFPILLELGLTESEALIYELLLEKGPSRPPDLVEPTGLGRGNIYNTLQQLAQKRLIVLKEVGKLQTYEAMDPGSLKQLLDKQLEKSRQLERQFSNELQSLSSLYTHSTGKPTVQVFEGHDGQKQALLDVLESKTEVLTYIDLAALSGPLASLDEWYDKLRVKNKIFNRILLADTPQNRALFPELPALTEIRVLSGYPSGFKTAVEIYDETVSYFTLTNEKQVAVIIKDPAIYAMQKQQFEFLWTQAAALSGTSIATNNSVSNTK